MKQEKELIKLSNSFKSINNFLTPYMKHSRRQHCPILLQIREINLLIKKINLATLNHKVTCQMRNDIVYKYLGTISFIMLKRSLLHMFNLF